jgi:hypothetical protein
MTGKRFAYTIATNDEVAGGPVILGDIGGGAPARGGIRHRRDPATQQRSRHDQCGDHERPTDPVKQTDFDQAITDCAAVGDKYQDTHFPSGTNELGEILLNNLTEIANTDHFKALADGYRACLDKAGYPAKS